MQRLELKSAQPAPASTLILIGDHAEGLDTFFAEAAPYGKALLIGDDDVAARYGEPIAAALERHVSEVLPLSFPAGELHKTRETVARIQDRMLAAGALRQGSLVVALGGGVSTDLAGFVAATYMRGLPYVNLPTSLLAQIDAAVGGKTGVNVDAGKNLIGAFHQPLATVIDPAFLASLPPRHLCNGLAELLKHGVIGDAELLGALERVSKLRTEPGAPVAHAAELLDWRILPEALLLRAVRVKAALVERDPLERGPRAWLNFGHTIGHALERALDYGLLHGEAVAVGMVIEAEIAARHHGLARETVERLVSLLDALDLPSRPPAGLPFDTLGPFLELDKKRRGQGLQMALPRSLGEMIGDSRRGHTVSVELAQAREAWDARS